MTNLFVLDTSALFALLEEEPGAGRVEEVLRQENTLIPWLALMELRYITEQELGLMEADARYLLALNLGAEIAWNSDEPLALTASRFKAAHRISLADAVIAATAHRFDGILLHKDPEYESLAGRIRMEALPYKG